MFSDKFKKFIQVWQEEYAIEKSIDEKLCLQGRGQKTDFRSLCGVCRLAFCLGTRAFRLRRRSGRRGRIHRTAGQGCRSRAE